MDETASRDGPTDMDVSAVAEAYSRPYYDATSGAELDEQRALAARFEELEEFKRRDAYAKVPENEALEKTGKKPISVRWVDVNKGDDRNPEYRSRLVVREVKRSQLDDVFAAMPPLEAKHMLFSLAVSGRAGPGDARKLSFVDVTKAYLHAPVRGGKHVQPPEEDAAGGMCEKLNGSLYGTRDAARN